MNRIGLWRRAWNVAKPYWSGDKKWQAFGLLAVLLAFLAGVNYLNYTLTTANGAIMNALQAKDQPTFWSNLQYIVMVFAGGSVIVTIYAWIRNILGLHWRNWLTKHLLDKYFANRAYYRVNDRQDIDNPDERLHQDVKEYTSAVLSIVLDALDSAITLSMFAMVLWHISQSLSAAAITYAFVGSLITLFVGRRLVKLNQNQLKVEADFRYGLIHVRNNVESIAFYRGEGRESAQVDGRFNTVVKNYRSLLAWTRNLGFFTKFYSYMDFALPMIIIAPLYFAGTAKLGDITQASMAFSMVLGSLSLVVNNFSGLSQLAAIITRLGSFAEALDEEVYRKGTEKIETVVADRLELKGVTVATPGANTRVLAADINVAVTAQEPLLIVGPSGSGKSSILRVIAGLWDSGKGVVVRPDVKDILFLPQRPYMILGSLRDQITYPNLDSKATDAELQAVLELVNLPKLAERVGGFGTILHWSDVLSLGEQQRLAFARLLLTKPRYAILDEATSALDVKNEEHLYSILAGSGVTFISVGHRPTLTRYHKQVLELVGDGTWRMRSVEDYLAGSQTK
jgi:putative ATP-binding cassette transporter